MCACIPHPPLGVVVNALLILTKKTWMLGVFDKVHLITVVSLRHPPYLCTQDGVSPGIPPQTTQHHPVHAVFVYIASLSAFSI